jgi:glycosyltransferase involved in cell wall biosynthesis
MEGTPLVSVVVCTCNPNDFTLDWVLDSLAQQTLASEQFEVVVVDNNSRVALTQERLRADRRLQLRVVPETEQGLVFARRKGIVEAAAPLLVFADDDNGLAANYLEEALRIARAEPSLGAFGGITKLLTDMNIPEWKLGLTPYLGIRNYGSTPIISSQAHWGEWEPIGAGMVVRQPIALHYVKIVESEAEAQLMSRRDGGVIAGEDTLLARSSYALGYSCSYQPSLRLTHFIKGTRMGARDLARTIYGIAQGYVINERFCGRPPAAVSWFAAAVELCRRLRYRIYQKGWRRGALEWFWDVGYFRQLRASAKTALPTHAFRRQAAGTGP